jgi:hypothetical protein
MSSVITRIIIALFCFAFLQCSSVIEKLKEIAAAMEEQQQEDESQEEPQPQPQSDTVVTNGKHRKSAD